MASETLVKAANNNDHHQEVEDGDLGAGDELGVIIRGGPLLQNEKQQQGKQEDDEKQTESEKRNSDQEEERMLPITIDGQKELEKDFDNDPLTKSIFGNPFWRWKQSSTPTTTADYGNSATKRSEEDKEKGGSSTLTTEHGTDRINEYEESETVKHTVQNDKGEITTTKLGDSIEAETTNTTEPSIRPCCEQQNLGKIESGPALVSEAGGYFRLNPFRRWRNEDLTEPETQIDNHRVDKQEISQPSDQVSFGEEVVENDAGTEHIADSDNIVTSNDVRPTETAPTKQGGYSWNSFPIWKSNLGENAAKDASNSTRKQAGEEEKETLEATVPSAAATQLLDQDDRNGISSDTATNAISPPPPPLATTTPSTTLADKMRKGAVAVAGGTLTAVGLVMIPLPTPMGCFVAGSGLSLLATEFEGAKKVQENCKSTFVSTRDRMIDHVERTIEEDGVQESAESDAICQTEEEAGIVISVNADGYYDDDNDDDDYDDDGHYSRRRQRNASDDRQQQRPTALQNYKQQLRLQTRAYLATSVLPLLHKTRGGNNADITATDDQIQEGR